jgi:hypothetical protein
MIMLGLGLLGPMTAARLAGEMPGLVPALHRAAAHAVRGKILAVAVHSLSPIPHNDLALANYLHPQSLMSSAKTVIHAETGG